MLVLRAVRSTLVTNASNQTIFEASCCVRRAHDRIEHHRARQVVERHVDALAAADQQLDLGIGLGAREVGIELDQHDLGHGQLRGAADLARDELGDERLRLPGRHRGT